MGKIKYFVGDLFVCDYQERIQILAISKNRLNVLYLSNLKIPNTWKITRLSTFIKRIKRLNGKYHFNTGSEYEYWEQLLDNYDNFNYKLN